MHSRQGRPAWLVGVVVALALAVTAACSSSKSDGSAAPTVAGSTTTGGGTTSAPTSAGASTTADGTSGSGDTTTTVANGLQGTWAELFGDSAPGSQCVRATEGAINASGTTLRQVATVTSRGQTSDGVSVAMEVTTTSSTTGSTPVSSSSTAEFVFANDGTFRTPRLGVPRGVTISQRVTYPSVAQLLAGDVFTGTIDANTAAGAGGIQTVPSAPIKITYRVRAIRNVDPIVTPGGVFPSALGVQVSVAKVESELTGAQATAIQQLATEIYRNAASVTWFVPKVGEVLFESPFGSLAVVECGGVGKPSGPLADTAKPSYAPGSKRLCGAYGRLATLPAGQELRDAATAKRAKNTADAAYKTLGAEVPQLQPDAEVVRGFTGKMFDLIGGGAADAQLSGALSSPESFESALSAGRLIAYGGNHCGFDPSQPSAAAEAAATAG